MKSLTAVLHSSVPYLRFYLTAALFLRWTLPAFVNSSKMEAQIEMERLNDAVPSRETTPEPAEIPPTDQVPLIPQPPPDYVEVAIPDPPPAYEELQPIARDPTDRGDARRRVIGRGDARRGLNRAISEPQLEAIKGVIRMEFLRATPLIAERVRSRKWTGVAILTVTILIATAVILVSVYFQVHNEVEKILHHLSKSPVCQTHPPRT